MRDRSFKQTLLFGAILGTSAFTTASASSCKYLYDSQTLELRGDLDKKMHECLESHRSDTIDRIIVRSGGGRVDWGMKIGDLVAEIRPDIVVRNQCNSSCANYLLPVAKSIRLEPGAMVLLHGALDEANVARRNKTATEEAQKTRLRMLEMQNSFVGRHNVHLGWFFFRTNEDSEEDVLGQHVVSQSRWYADDALDVNFVMAGEDFMRSCLKGVEIIPSQDTMEARYYAEPKWKKRLTKRKVHPTADMRCKTERDTD